MRLHGWVSVLAAAAAAVLLAGCETSTAHQVTSPTSSTVPSTSPDLDPRECARSASTGDIDRSAYDLHFTTGRLLVSVTPTGRASTCYSFTKAGNPNPEVPPDTLLFTFAGPGTDGAQLEFLAGDMSGAGLPPADGQRPTVHPLTGPINAQVGVSVGGGFHTATTCRLTITAMAALRAAGSFDCPGATLSTANPFAPDDEGPFDGESSSAPSTPVAPDTVRLAGWFELTP